MNIKNDILYWILMILIISFGVFAIVFGESDDSPGLQGIGLIFIIAAVISIFRRINKK